MIYLDSSVALAYLLAEDHRAEKEVPEVNRLRPQASALMPPLSWKGVELIDGNGGGMGVRFREQRTVA
jgi:hypothetical protein